MSVAGSQSESGRPITLTIRPERLTLLPAGNADDSTFPGTVARTLFLGPILVYLVTLQNGPTIRVTLRHEGHRIFNEGDPVAVHFALDAFQAVSE